MFPFKEGNSETSPELGIFARACAAVDALESNTQAATLASVCLPSGLLLLL